MKWHELQMRARCDLPELKSMPKAEFLAWLAAHPRLYAAFRYYARQALDSGRPRFSCYMIRERVRWYVDIEKQKGDKYKISNNVTPYMARVLAMDMPALLDIFSFKGEGDSPPDLFN